MSTRERKKRWYLCGPMSGIPKFNIPAFDAAASVLRHTHGLQVVSPTELDSGKIRRECLRSPDGKQMPGDETWGNFLARDVKLVADQVDGIILMDGWTNSRGARLEAFVGLLTGKEFMRYHDGEVPTVQPWHPDIVRGFIRSNMP